MRTKRATARMFIEVESPSACRMPSRAMNVNESDYTDAVVLLT
ncbi:hypothetical protein [Roseimaritima multifibrata]|nr:hypothetical protein [Roseimaritima multifibrata]